MTSNKKIAEYNNCCPVCSSKSFKHKYTWFDYNFNFEKKIWYEIIECKKCWLEQIYPIPTKQDQIHFYPSIYYDKDDMYQQNKLKYKCIEMENLLFKLFDKKYFNLPNYNWKNKNFLDIWCWDWKNLKIMEKNGRNAKWFEINCDKFYQSNIYHAPSIINIDFNEKYDVIRCNHVFEHVDNPREFLFKVRSILKDDWIFIINLPNVKWLSWYIFWKYATERDIPRHIFGYNYENIQNLFQNLWFNIIHKHRWRQFWMATSLTRFLLSKFNVDIRKYKILYILLWFLFIPIEFIISITRFTNSMWFVLKK